MFWFSILRLPQALRWGDKSLSKADSTLAVDVPMFLCFMLITVHKYFITNFCRKLPETHKDYSIHN